MGRLTFLHQPIAHHSRYHPNTAATERRRLHTTGRRHYGYNNFNLVHFCYASTAVCVSANFHNLLCNFGRLQFC